MTRIQATWITDHAYLTPTILSIASFEQQIRRPSRVIVPSSERNHLEVALRRALPDVELEIEDVSSVASAGPTGRSPSATVWNRLVRIESLRSATGPMMLVDSDTAFGPRIVELLEGAERDCHQRPFVAAAVEFEAARDAYLYFRPRRVDGSIGFSPSERQDAVRAEVFGPDWARLLHGPQPNNGLIIGNDASRVATAWRDRYERGLRYSEVNPADDQVPLAVALTSTNTPLRRLPGWANSLGQTRGEFAVYHAYSGLWRDELRAAALDLPDLSSFGSAWRLQLDRLDPAVVTRLRSDAGPRLHLALSGYLEGAALLDRWVDRYSTFVELDRSNARGTAYLAERLRDGTGPARFASIQRADDADPVTPNRWFEANGLDAYVDLARTEDHGWWREVPLDAVFLNVADPEADPTGFLETWFPRLRAGGAIGGTCYRISDPFAPGLRASVDRFARGHRLRVDAVGGCFELIKPSRPMDEGPARQANDPDRSTGIAR